MSSLLRVCARPTLALASLTLPTRVTAYQTTLHSGGGRAGALWRARGAAGARCARACSTTTTSGSAAGGGRGELLVTSKPGVKVIPGLGAEQMSPTPFSESPLRDETKTALAVIGMNYMSRVQAAALNFLLRKNDSVLRCRKSTGRGTAVILSILDQAVDAGELNGPFALLLAPTREAVASLLATAKALAEPMGLTVHGFVQGNSMIRELNLLRNSPPHLLIGTPERMADHASNHPKTVKLTELRVFAYQDLDEMLRAGQRRFLDAIRTVVSQAANKHSLVYSNEFSVEANAFIMKHVAKNYRYLDCIGKEENLFENIPQAYVFFSLEKLFEELYMHLDHLQKSANDFKVAVFFNKLQLAAFYWMVFKDIGVPICQHHGRMSQVEKSEQTEKFNNNQRSILFTTDCISQGITYLELTHVIHVGMPESRQVYLQRVSRLAPVAEKGRSLMLLADFEEVFLNELTDIPVVELSPMVDAQTPVKFLEQLHDTLDRSDRGFCSKALIGWIDQYHRWATKLGWSPQELIDAGIFWFRDICRQRWTPTFPVRELMRMGLHKQGVDGISVDTSDLRFNPGSSRKFRGKPPRGFERFMINFPN